MAELDDRSKLSGRMCGKDATDGRDKASVGKPLRSRLGQKSDPSYEMVEVDQ